MHLTCWPHPSLSSKRLAGSVEMTTLPPPSGCCKCRKYKHIWLEYRCIYYVRVMKLMPRRIYITYRLLNSILVQGQMPIVKEDNPICTRGKDTGEDTREGAFHTSLWIWQWVTMIGQAIAQARSIETRSIEHGILIFLHPRFEEGIIEILPAGG